jgi:hypothetical protein
MEVRTCNSAVLELQTYEITPALTPELLDRTLIIGGKCVASNGSGKSPGLNQFVFKRFRARLPFALRYENLGRLLPILYKPQSQSNCFKRFQSEA